MKSNATAVANYFIRTAKEKGEEIFLLGLIKRVYITHGFTLAFFDKPAIDERFDKVEAWKYGPVIPSVYHSFKQNGKNPITEFSKIVKFSDDGSFKEECTPELIDEDVKKIADMVWTRYRNMSDSELIDLTHQPGTPWSLSYFEGENRPIEDWLTKHYYNKIREKVGNGKN